MANEPPRKRPLRPRHGRESNLISGSRTRDNYDIDYVTGYELYTQHPAHEGRRRETILKAERDVASPADGNRGYEKPGTAAWQQCQGARGLRVSPATGQSPGTKAVPGRQRHGGAP